jgi:hypothetical protein
MLKGWKALIQQSRHAAQTPHGAAAGMTVEPLNVKPIVR